MDCEKFESAMMDELYGELDEVTSAAVKRHAAGCTRCAALLDGLRATRRLAALPTMDLPEGLEARILSLTQETTVVVPLRRRVARGISLAGAWAMRPQTAMAAVFLVMIGTSVLFLRGRPMKDAASVSAPVTVTEEGSPALEPNATAWVAASAGPAAGPAGSMTTLFPPVGHDDPFGHALPKSVTALRDKDKEDDEQATRGALPPPPAAAAPVDAPLAGGVAGGGGAVAGDLARAQGSEKKAPSAFDSAVQAFQAGHFDDAARGFDALAPKNPTAELWAARSVRDGKGCRAALQRFDQAAQSAAGTPTGWDALLEGARCYRAVGQPNQARTRLSALLNVDSHKDAARKELDILDQQAAGQGAVRMAPARAAEAPAAAPAPPPAKAAPSSPVDMSH
jgi:hypothetical protein